MTGLNTASREAMKSAQVVACDSLQALDGALCEVRKESSVCIIACVTEMLLAGDGSGTVASSIESVLTSFKAKLKMFLAARSTVQLVVAPPLFRFRPFWYQRSLPQISGLFSCIMSNDVPNNLWLLGSFCSQDLMPDGIHLTPVSGLHYALYLFDNTESVLRNAAATSDAQLFTVQEVCRQHDDRLVFLEQRHARLDIRFDFKAAIDAEFSDWVTNRGEEDWITVLGAARLSPDLDSRAWQRAVKKQMTDLIKFVLTTTKNRVDFTVLYVVNPIRNRTTGQTVLNVRMNSVEVSKRIREIYSGFFGPSARVKLPSALKGVSLRNKVTLDTRIRIKIMGQLGLNFQESSGPGSSFKVKGYESRPLLVTTPAAKSGTRPRTYNFIEAVKNLPAMLSDENLVQIHQVVGEHHQGELQTLFVILQDDDRARVQHLIREKYRKGGPSSHPITTDSSTGVVSGHLTGFGSGMDATASSLALLRLPPPPPPPSPPRVKKATAVRSAKGRSSGSGSKRRHRRSSDESLESPRRQGAKRRHQSSSVERSKSSKHQKRYRRRSTDSESESSGHRKRHSRHYSSSESGSSGSESRHPRRSPSGSPRRSRSRER